MPQLNPSPVALHNDAKLEHLAPSRTWCGGGVVAAVVVVEGWGGGVGGWEGRIKQKDTETHTSHLHTHE